MDMSLKLSKFMIKNNNEIDSLKNNNVLKEMSLCLGKELFWKVFQAKVFLQEITFRDKHSPKGFTTTKSVLQKILEGIL